MARKHTTETLRTDLFEVMRDLRKGNIDAETAAQVVRVSDQIIKTADLELKYAQTLSHLDKDGQGIEPGKMLLADQSGEDEKG